MPTKGKNKTTKKRTCWLFTKDHYWTRETFSLCVRSFEECNSSSSSFTTNASRRWWSGPFLENKRKSSESICSNSSLVRQSMESMLGSRRRSKKRRYQYCTDVSGIIVYFRALQGHSGRNLIQPSLQDNVVIPSKFVQYIYHIGCAFNLHSIINNGLILGGQNSSKRQTVFFLLVDPRDKCHKDPDEIDLNVPRRAQHLHNAWKVHQDAENWVNINLAIQKGLKFYQTRSNAIILQETLPAYCIPKVVRLKTAEVLHDKVYMSPRLPPKISLKHEWTRELGSKVARQPKGEVARQPEGEVARQAQISNQPNQLQIQFVTDRGDLMTCKMEETRPVPRRLMLILFAKNSVLQTERCDLLRQKSFKRVHLKTERVPMLSRLMTERCDLLLLFIQLKHKTALEYVLLMKAIRSTSMMKYFVKEWKIHCCSWRESWTNDGGRGRHGLPNSRTSIFRCEIRAKYQRSSNDSENWEPSRSTWSSKRSTTESII